MALHLTLENIHKLYHIDPSTKMEGIVILCQKNSPDVEIGVNSRLFDGLLLGFLIRGTMKVQDDAPFQFSGAPFLLASILMFISLVIVYFNFQRKNRGTNRWLQD